MIIAFSNMCIRYFERVHPTVILPPYWSPHIPGLTVVGIDYAEHLIYPSLLTLARVNILVLNMKYQMSSLVFPQDFPD